MLHEPTPVRLVTAGSVLRRALDGLYLGAGIVAGVFTVALLAVIVAQMICRWLGVAFPGSADYAGYCMAQSSFLALAHALNRGAHIRVGLLLGALGRHRFWAELWCLTIGTGLAGWFAWYAIRAVRMSQLLNDVSQGQDATPIWIPQLGMAIGVSIFAVALLDNLLRLLRTGAHGIDEDPAERFSDSGGAAREAP